MAWKLLQSTWMVKRLLENKGPKDGRSRGLCGPFNGNRGIDYRTMRAGRGSRGHGQEYILPRICPRPGINHS